MKIMASATERSFIPISVTDVPSVFDVKLVNRTYRLELAYNEVGDFFTVSLSTPAPNEEVLCYAEVIRYGKPLFEQVNDERYPLPLIIPLCADGTDIDTVTYDNLGQRVKLWMVERGTS
jgi:hypothetical protein